jgi:hypothetical protein
VAKSATSASARTHLDDAPSIVIACSLRPSQSRTRDHWRSIHDGGVAAPNSFAARIELAYARAVRVRTGSWLAEVSLRLSRAASSAASCARSNLPAVTLAFASVLMVPEPVLRVNLGRWMETLLPEKCLGAARLSSSPGRSLRCETPRPWSQVRQVSSGLRAASRNEPRSGCRRRAGSLHRARRRRAGNGSGRPCRPVPEQAAWCDARRVARASSPPVRPQANRPAPLQPCRPKATTGRALRIRLRSAAPPCVYSLTGPGWTSWTMVPV